MADSPVVQIGENSREEVAFKLWIRVGSAEGKLNPSGFPKEEVDRKWMLGTFAECLDAVSGRRDY